MIRPHCKAFNSKAVDRPRVKSSVPELICVKPSSLEVKQTEACPPERASSETFTPKVISTEDRVLKFG